MKIYVALVLLLSFAIRYGYPQEGSPKQATPLEDIYVYDFGKVKEGEILQHTFMLKNNSVKKLTIENLITSCGCTSAKVKDNVLLPGKSTAIEVKLDTKGYSGSLEQYVYVYTDNPRDPLLRFILKGEVIP